MTINAVDSIAFGGSGFAELICRSFCGAPDRSGDGKKQLHPTDRRDPSSPFGLAQGRLSLCSGRQDDSFR
jgi:hypothetical protein